MGFWRCECGCDNRLDSTKCSNCGRVHIIERYEKKANPKNGTANKGYPYTIVYMQNGREMRNIVDAKKKESAVTKFLKALTRITEYDIVDVLEGEHLDW